jgi:hypothetical protein
MSSVNSDATVKNFLKLFTSRWSKAMSGPLSVPFTIAAFAVNNIYGKVLCALLAIVCAVFSSYWIWKREREAVLGAQMRIDDLLTPKIRIEHNATKDIGPSQVTLAAISASTTITQCRVRLINESAISIPGVEMFFEDFQVLTPQPESYMILFAGGLHPITLTPYEEFPAGVIREIVERDTANMLYGGVTSKRIEVHAYSRLPRSPGKGKEFLVTLRVRGELTLPSLPKSYIFGDRDGQLFFEEFRKQSNPECR